ncbi:hypothetical protein [Moorena producens]|uniref:hypothetical protein n=1 Tax=Moorena producens TaxID=1155739 RepID=UPI001E3CFDC9|nr:hypothetical protein [Moorena producens]
MPKIDREIGRSGDREIGRSGDREIGRWGDGDNFRRIFRILAKFIEPSLKAVNQLLVIVLMQRIPCRKFS